MRGNPFSSLTFTVPIDTAQYKAILSVRVHKCDICNDHITEAPDNIESLIDILKEIDDSYESEYDKREPTLLLCNYCKKEYQIPSYN